MEIRVSQGASGSGSGSGGGAGTGTNVLESRIHDCATVNINDNAGAFVEFGTLSPYDAAALLNTVTTIRISANIGEPLAFAKGANAGAAALAANSLFVSNQGEGPTAFGVALVIGDRIWVRSLSVNPVASGLITLNLAG